MFHVVSAAFAKSLELFLLIFEEIEVIQLKISNMIVLIALMKIIYGVLNFSRITWDNATFLTKTHQKLKFFMLLLFGHSVAK